VSSEDVVYRAFESSWRSKAAHAVADVRPHTESPIEEIMGASLLIGLQEFAAALSLRGQASPVVRLGPFEAFEDDHILIVPQYEWGGFRIDFAIFAKVAKDMSATLFVECDGHDFHERTKEQAARDRSKDRKIQEAGISVYRFTGREIYRDPEACVVQVMDFITNKWTSRP
jgi:very-short-patch-repair endonuclease